MALLFMFNLQQLSIAYSQSNELIHLRLFESEAPAIGVSKLHSFPADSTFIFFFRTGQTNINVGIWEDDFISNLPGNIVDKVIFYDQSFNRLDEILLPGGGSFSSMFNPLGRIGSSWYFKGYTANTNNAPFTSSIPVLSSTQQIVYSNNLLLGYNTDTDNLNHLNHWQNNSNMGSIYNGFQRRMLYLRNVDITYSGALLADNSLITTTDLFSSHTHNWDQNYNTIPGHWGYLHNRTNIETGVTEVIPVVSSNGQVVTRAMHAASGGTGIYRIGMVQGNNMPISPSGNLWQTNPNDSTYFTFLAKENNEGVQEWAIPLYGFNNSANDTTSLNSPAYMDYFSTTYTFAELGNSLFFSHSTFSSFSDGDTLFTTDFLGNTVNYSAALNGTLFAFSSKSVYKVTSTGVPELKLSYDLIDNSAHVVMSTNGSGFKEHIFNVGDKLAWLNVHHAVEPANAIFRRENSTGEIEFLEQAIPAGKSWSISWLDENLNFVEFWIIPFEAQTVDPSIEHISRFSGDTIVVQGNIFGNSSSAFDPNGLAPNYEFQNNASFIAFYSATNILSTQESKYPPKSELVLYPNPCRAFVRCRTTIPKGSYRILGLEGRTVLSGNFNASPFDLDLSHVNPGMYILQLIGSGKSVVGKFIKSE